VTEALARARSYGVAVRFADLGDWGRDQLRAEYDPAIPEIRLNLRVTSKLSFDQFAEFVALAVGHELYHHLEHIGEVRVIKNRRARESAADRFGRALMESPP
jgi:hypothetical protein